MGFEASRVQQQLGQELMDIRKGLRLTHQAVADALGWDRTKVGRIEKAQNQITHEDVVKLATYYGLPGDEAQRLATMALQSRTNPWWEPYKELLPSPYYRMIGYENDATHDSVLRPTLVHGLLQTPRYMAALFDSGVLIRDEERITAHVEVRKLRQRRLFEPTPLALDVTMPEAVLVTAFGGPDVLREQLEHLRSMTDLPNVTLRILPMAAPVAIDQVELFDFNPPGGPAIAVTEAVFGIVIHDDPMDVRQGRRVYEHVRGAALSPVESVTVIEEKIKELKQ